MHSKMQTDMIVKKIEYTSEERGNEDRAIEKFDTGCYEQACLAKVQQRSDEDETVRGEKPDEEVKEAVSRQMSGLASPDRNQLASPQGIKSDGGSEITYQDNREKTSEQKEHDKELADRWNLQSFGHMPYADQEEQKAPEAPPKIEELEIQKEKSLEVVAGAYATQLTDESQQEAEQEINDKIEQERSAEK